MKEKPVGMELQEEASQMGKGVGGGVGGEAVCDKEQIGGPVRGMESVGGRNIRMENCGGKKIP